MALARGYAMARHRLVLVCFYFSGLSNRIIRKKNLVPGDWSQSNETYILFCKRLRCCYQIGSVQTIYITVHIVL